MSSTVRAVRQAPACDNKCQLYVFNSETGEWDKATGKGSRKSSTHPFVPFWHEGQWVYQERQGDTWVTPTDAEAHPITETPDPGQAEVALGANAPSSGVPQMASAT